MTTPGNGPASDWPRFSSLSHLVDHWDRPGWRDGRSAYYWYLTFDSPELNALARDCQQQLGFLGLDMVEPDWLHLSLVRLGWSDETSSASVLDVAEKAAKRCADIPPFGLDVGPLAGSAGAVRFSVSSWEPLVQLCEQLAAANDSISSSAPKSAFLPHITIGYNNHPRPAAPVIRAVAELRTTPTISVDVVDAALVKVHREGHSYKWDTVARVPLGTG
jgi:2'-5' RNA ligase